MFCSVADKVLFPTKRDDLAIQTIDESAIVYLFQYC